MGRPSPVPVQWSMVNENPPLFPRLMVMTGSTAACVPWYGDRFYRGYSKDHTRKAEYYDSTFNYLKLNGFDGF